MKKLVVHICQQRFDLESRGQEQDAFIQAKVRELNTRIEKLRREHGFPDNARATALLALMLEMEKSGGEGAAIAAAASAQDAEHAKILHELTQKVEHTLERTASSPAKTSTQ